MKKNEQTLSVIIQKSETTIQNQLYILEEKLRQEGSIMSKAKRSTLMTQIHDLHEQIARPEEKLAQMKQNLVKLENRAAIFDPASLDYKIIANSIHTFRQYVQKMEQQIQQKSIADSSLQKNDLLP